MAFGLKHLLFMILVIAVGLAALLNADRPPVADIIELTTFVIIVVVGYGIWTSDGQQRAFRIGFVCWSGLYYLASSWFAIAYRLPTYEILRIAARNLQPMRVATAAGNPIRDMKSYWHTSFVSIGQCLFALLLGLVGGWVTVYFYRKRQRMLARQT